MKLIIARHGETDWNRACTVQGRLNTPLNAHGRLQAAALANRLKNAHIERVYTSPLERAYDTGKAIAAANGCETVALPGLIEIGFAEWEGKRYTDIAKLWPDDWALWCKTPELLRVKNAETLEQIMTRCVEALNVIFAECADMETVAIASHTLPVKLIIAHYAGLPLNNIHKIRVDNCAYSEIDAVDAHTGKLVTLNDMTHLGGVHSPRDGSGI